MNPTGLKGEPGMKIRKTPSYLLTWNESSEPWATLAQDAKKTRLGRPVTRRWKTHRHDIKRGDRVLLLKQGKKMPRGVMAGGQALSAAYRKPRQYWSHVRVRFDVILDSTVDRLFDCSQLKFHSKHWSNKSGSLIPEKLALRVEAAWKRHLTALGINPGGAHRPLPAAKARAGQGRRGSPIPPADDGYLRATKAELKYICRRHATLGMQFSRWLTANGCSDSDVDFEKLNVDIEFIEKGQLSRAELKVCGSLSTTKALREAVGQLLEYNYYGSREPANRWFIVLDKKPSEQDRTYVRRLRSVLKVPLFLYWPDGGGFVSDFVSPRSADNAAAPGKDN